LSLGFHQSWLRCPGLGRARPWRCRFICWTFGAWGLGASSRRLWGCRLGRHAKHSSLPQFTQLDRSANGQVRRVWRKCSCRAQLHEIIFKPNADQSDPSNMAPIRQPPTSAANVATSQICGFVGCRRLQRCDNGTCQGIALHRHRVVAEEASDRSFQAMRPQC
jgi:hypothetical protein